MNEVWKSIHGFSNYEVSSSGRVRSIDHFDSLGRKQIGKVLKPKLDSRKHYLHVCLYKDGKSIPVNIHRLVATEFIENPNGYKEVNHKDEDKTNNAVSNLEWCTHKYNNNYGSKRESTRGANNPMSKITQDVAEFIKKHHLSCGGTMRNIELSKMFNLSPTHVCAVAHGRRWKYANSD